MFGRSLAAFTLANAAATRAWADLAPEPTDPSSPYFWVALLAAVAAITGYFVYRRRRK